jgi:ubiquinone/menaquinone biosynthesis C-methylase UbiE
MHFFIDDQNVLAEASAPTDTGARFHRLWNGLKFSSLAELLSLYPTTGLSALDVGTGSGNFPHDICEAYPEKFVRVAGIDQASGSSVKSSCGATQLELKYGISFDSYSRNSGESFDFIFFNAAAVPTTTSQFLESCRRCLRPHGAVVVTFFWEPFLTPVFDAFDEDQSVVETLARVTASTSADMKYNTWLLESLEGLPKTAYQAIPKGLVLFPSGIPGANDSATSRAVAMAKVTTALGNFDSCWESTENNKLRITIVLDSLKSLYTIRQECAGADLWWCETGNTMVARGELDRVIEEIKIDIGGGNHNLCRATLRASTSVWNECVMPRER